MADAVRPGCSRDRGSSDTCVPHHAVQITDAPDRGDLIRDASLVSFPHSGGVAAHRHIHDWIMDGRSLVEPYGARATAAASLRRHLDGATESLRMDVQSTAQPSLCESH